MNDATEIRAEIKRIERTMDQSVYIYPKNAFVHGFYFTFGAMLASLLITIIVFCLIVIFGITISSPFYAIR